MPGTLARNGCGGRVAARGLVRALAAGAALVAAAGCAGPGPAAAPVPRPAVEPARLTALHARPPVTALLFTSHRTGAEAQRKLAIACMAEGGHRYAPAPPSEAAGGADERPQPFGIESAAPRRAAAATSSETPPAPGGPESTDAYARALFGREEKRVTAKGVRISVSRPGEGCLAEAETRMFGDGRMRWLQVRILLFEAQEEARRDVEKDPVFREATVRWRECMDRARIKAQDPVQVQESLRSPEEARTSPVVAADLGCKAETGYLATAYERLAAVQRRWLDGHPDVGADWKRLSARQDQAAAAVLGTRG
ncbi:hypothetical protein [Streptomyces omiyaensis]|uniref:hypothetical protein n=1 Tax=Streptomyces omiyaensis TaxID=68247 RepID=UPI0036F697F9